MIFIHGFAETVTFRLFNYVNAVKLVDDLKQKFLYPSSAKISFAKPLCYN